MRIRAGSAEERLSRVRFAVALRGYNGYAVLTPANGGTLHEISFLEYFLTARYFVALRALYGLTARENKKRPRGRTASKTV